MRELLPGCYAFYLVVRPLGLARLCFFLHYLEGRALGLALLFYALSILHRIRSKLHVRVTAGARTSLPN